MTKPLVGLLALVVGSIVTGVILLLIKKNISDEEYDSTQLEEEQEMDLSGFSLNG